MVLGDVAFGMQLGHKGRALGGVVSTARDPEVSPTLFPPSVVTRS